MKTTHRSGVRNALLAAALFGASTPFAKLLLSHDRLSPVVLAGALYLGSGFGLALWRVWNRQRATVWPVGNVSTAPGGGAPPFQPVARG